MKKQQKAKQSIDNATTNEAVDQAKTQRRYNYYKEFNLIPLKGRSETRN